MWRQVGRSMLLASALTGTSQAQGLLGTWSYQPTPQNVTRPVTETRWVERQQTVWRERVTTDQRETIQTQWVPVASSQVVAERQPGANWWSPPTTVYRTVPTTQWQAQSVRVKVPVVRRELVPETQTVRVPVIETRYQTQTVNTLVPQWQPWRPSGSGGWLMANRTATPASVATLPLAPLTSVVASTNAAPPAAQATSVAAAPPANPAPSGSSTTQTVWPARNGWVVAAASNSPAGYQLRSLRQPAPNVPTGAGAASGPKIDDGWRASQR